MITTTTVLIMMVLILVCFFALSQGMEMSETQRRARRKMMICVAVCVPLYVLAQLILFSVPIEPAKRSFLMSLTPIPLFIALLCCHFWAYRLSIRKFSSISLITAFGILFIFMVFNAVHTYHLRVNIPRNPLEMPNLPERLPPLVPPPVDWTPPQLPPAAPDPSPAQN